MWVIKPFGAAQVRLGMGVAGGSWAYAVTAFNQIWMLAAYILLTGRASIVWGLRPSAAAFKVGGLAVAASWL